MKILLLAGSGEARELASLLVDRRVPVVASLAGATREAARYSCDTRVGGFGGADAFKAYLRTEKITHVIDATHPFAVNISRRSAACCAQSGIPFLQLLRPEWRPQEGDNWQMIESPTEARKHIKSGAQVFLATGRQTLGAFANLDDCHLYCRQIDPPEAPFPFENGEYIIDRPPFSVAHEIEVFQRLGIDVLIVKNAGGEASRSKLDAARDIGLPVVMISRPAPLNVDTVTTVDGALQWVDTHADH